VVALPSQREFSARTERVASDRGSTDTRTKGSLTPNY
jgi:hypothetical protein